MTERWAPSVVRRVDRPVPGTSTEPVICETDRGLAYVKCSNNPVGPDALACELVGTRLASWIGLPTFQTAVVSWPSGWPDRHVKTGTVRAAGPALATLAEKGVVWDGSPETLRDIANPEACAGLVLVDTWLRNHDRFWVRGQETRRNLNNVFLRFDPKRGRRELMAIDFTEAIRRGSPLNPRVAGGEFVREAEVYGRFPEFEPLLGPNFAPYAAKLRRLERGFVEEVVAEIPGTWGVPSETRRAMVTLIVERARFVLDRLLPELRRGATP